MLIDNYSIIKSIITNRMDYHNVAIDDLLIADINNSETAVTVIFSRGEPIRRIIRALIRIGKLPLNNYYFMNYNMVNLNFELVILFDTTISVDYKIQTFFDEFFKVIEPYEDYIETGKYSLLSTNIRDELFKPLCEGKTESSYDCFMDNSNWNIKIPVITIDNEVRVTEVHKHGLIDEKIGEILYEFKKEYEPKDFVYYHAFKDNKLMDLSILYYENEEEDDE